MPRKKVEVIVEFECDDGNYEDVLNEIVAAVEETLPSATSVFTDVVSVEDI